MARKIKSLSVCNFLARTVQPMSKLQPWTKLVGTLHLSFYQSSHASHAYVTTSLPQSNVDYYVLLVAARFSKCNTYFNNDWGEGGANDEV